MNYEEKYNAALERAKYALTTDMDNSGHWAVNYIFPELRVSNNERMLREIKRYIKEQGDKPTGLPNGTVPVSDMIAWLEEQGKKKSVDEVLKICQKLYQSGYNDGYKHGQEDTVEIDERIRKAIYNALKYLETELSWDFVDEVDILDIYAWLEKQNDKDKLIKEYEKYINWLEKQAEPNPYSGTSFKYNSHTWGMCARDNGVEILFDGELKAFLSLEKSFIYPIYPKPDLAHKSAIEAIKDNVDNNNKVKPKFHEGDWVILTAGELSTTLQIVNVDTNKKLYWFNDSSYLPIVDEDCLHLWSINDAKNGDVLAINWHKGDDSWEKIIIFKKYHNKGVKGLYSMPCVEGYGNTFKNGKLAYQEEVPYYSKTWTDNLHPATKEQCDLLFEEMTQAGYEWDAEKKELFRQTLKITPKFCVGQLITDNNGTWYKILNIECLDDWYYKVYDIAEDKTQLELCSIVDEKFRANSFDSEIKKMMGD